MKKHLKKEFENFIDSPIPSLMDNYKLRETSMWVKVFFYVPEKKSKLVGVDGRGIEEMYARSYPIGKVLNVGPDSDYSVGDFVKLRDSDFGLVVNPEYDRWTRLQESDADLMLKKVEAPIQYLDATQVREFLVKREVYPNFMILDIEYTNIPKSDEKIYSLDQVHVEAKIDNPRLLIS